MTREELDERIRQQAAHYNVSVEKMRKELEEHDRLKRPRGERFCWARPLIF